MAQNKAARLILNCSPLTSTIDMHCNLGWFYVEKRILMNLLVNFYSVVKKQSPHFLDLNIIYTNEIHLYSTRAASNEHIILSCPKSDFLKRSVLYRATGLWNILPRYIHEARHRNCFKRKLRANLTLIWVNSFVVNLSFIFFAFIFFYFNIVYLSIMYSCLYTFITCCECGPQEDQLFVYASANGDPQIDKQINEPCNWIKYYLTVLNYRVQVQLP